MADNFKNLLYLLALSVFVYVLHIYLISNAHACGPYGSGCPNRTYIGVFMYDTDNNRIGLRNTVDETSGQHSCSFLPDSRTGFDIVKGPGTYTYNGTTINNAMDGGANGSVWKCENNGRWTGGGFDIRSYRPSEGGWPAYPRGLAFRAALPSTYSCNNVYWQRTSGSTVLADGRGCDITAPLPSDDYRFSVHIYVDFFTGPPPRISYQCNSNGTVTLNWGSVSGAAEYAWRLDEQGSTSNSPTYNWYTSPPDQFGYTSNTTATIPIQYNTRYSWAVTSTRNPGSHPGPNSWSPAFSCNPPSTPTPTPAPFVNILARAPGGVVPVQVRGMSFNYGNCGGWNVCFSTPVEHVSSTNSRGFNRSPGGAGIVLYNDQRLLGITPGPGGGSYTIRNNNGSGWINSSSWHSYWWPSFPVSGPAHNLTFIIATVTPTRTPTPTNTPIPTNTPSATPTNSATPTRTPTPTPSPYCTDSDGGINLNTQGTTRAWFTNGTSHTVSDFCTGSLVSGSYRQFVREYSCQPGSGSTGTNRTSTTYNCPSGKACLNGACDCIPVSSPSNLQPNGTIGPGSRAITWNAVSSAARYALRIDDLSNGTHGNPCTSGQPGDRCATPTANSYNYNFIAGRSYRIWVHAISGCDGSYSSPATLVNASVPPPTPTNTPTSTPTNTPTPTPTPYCTDSDGGNEPDTAGTTRAWFTTGTNNSRTDTCGSTAYGATITEYVCLPGEGSSGTTRTTRTSTCTYGCTQTPGGDQCNPPPPDLQVETVTRQDSGTNYVVEYCNRGPGGTTDTFTMRVQNTDTTPTTTRNYNNQPVPAPGSCRTVNVPCANLGDPFCDEETTIVVTLDVGNRIDELLPDGETNNTATFNFGAIADEVFYKLKDAALHRLRNIDIAIPDPVAPFDGDDTNEQTLIIGSEGIATSTGDRIRVISENNRKVSNNNFQKEEYTDSKRYLNDMTSFITYVKAQKPVKEVANMGQLESNQIHYRSGNWTITNQPPAGTENIVIIAEGNVTLNVSGGTFNTNPNRSVAIISTGTITINPSITTVNAILIANNVNLGTSPRNRLKINGNLISNTVIDPVSRNVGTNTPNLFIVFNPKMYVDLLPYLSDITLEGRQVE